jgi:hypothetical protein
MIQLILGPILGIIGGAIEKINAYKLEQLKFKNRALERDHDLKVLQAEAAITDRRIQVEGEIKVNQIDAETFQSSYRMHSDPLLPSDIALSSRQVSWVLFVEILSRSIRPVSTVMYQVFLACIFGWSAMKIAQSGGQFLSTGEFHQMFRELVYSIVGMAEASFFWWFGIRGKSNRVSGRQS